MLDTFSYDDISQEGGTLSRLSTRHVPASESKEQRFASAGGFLRLHPLVGTITQTMLIPRTVITETHESARWHHEVHIS